LVAGSGIAITAQEGGSTYDDAVSVTISAQGGGTYQLLSEKNQNSGYAGLGSSGLVAPAQLGTGSDGTDRKILTSAQTYVQVGDFVGAWSSGSNYVLNDMVLRGGWVFIASQASGPAGVGAKDPLTQSTFWDVLATGSVESYQQILSYQNYIDAGFAASTYFGSYTNFTDVGAGNAVLDLAAFWLDPADYVVPSSKSLKLRTRLVCAVNNTAPAASFQLGLYPLTSPSGAAAVITGTVGSVVGSSQTSVITTPAANSLTTVVSGDFAFPTAGAYLLGIIVSGGTVATNSRVGTKCSLTWRIV
jgi:hypothetical protein